MRAKMTAIRKTLQIAWELDRKLMILIAFTSAIGAAKPYIPIYLGAYIINGFMTGISAVTMVITSVICFAGIFVVDAIQGLIDKVRDVHIETCVMDFGMKQARRTLEMDYQLLESPEVNALRTRIKHDNSWGAGFYSVFWNLPALLGSIVNLIVSSAILIPLFMTGSGSQNLLSLAFVGGAVLVALTTGFVTGRAGDLETAMTDELQKKKKDTGHFEHMYWGGGMDYKKGKDARIYSVGALMRSYFDPADQWFELWMKKVTKTWATISFADSFTSGLIWGGAFLFVTLQAIAGVITVGAVLLYANALNKFAKGLTDLANSFSQFAVTAKRQQAVLEYMNYPDVLHKGTLPVE